MFYLYKHYFVCLVINIQSRTVSPWISHLCEHVSAVCVFIERQIFVQDFDGVLFKYGCCVDSALNRRHRLSEDTIHKDDTFL